MHSKVEYAIFYVFFEVMRFLTLADFYVLINLDYANKESFMQSTEERTFVAIKPDAVKKRLNRADYKKNRK